MRKEDKGSSECHSRDSLATHDNIDGRWQSSYSGSFEGGQGVVLDVVSVKVLEEILQPFVHDLCMKRKGNKR